MAIAPYFNGVSILSERQLAADRGGRFFAATVVGAERSIDIMETDHASLEAEIFPVVAAGALDVELFPTVAVFGVGRVGILLFKRGNIGVLLQITGIDTGA